MSRHPLRLLLVTVLSLVILSGCSDDLRHRNVFDGGAGDAVITFSVENISLTRSGEEMESKIDHAYLLFYALDANPDTSVPVAAVKAVVSESNPKALTFKMPLRLAPNTDYRLVAVANADSFVPDGFSNFKDYLDSWCCNSSTDRGLLRLFHSAPLVADEIVSLPMRGGLVEDVPFSFSVNAGVYKVSASLSFRRKVARIDVANIVKDGFVVEGVALCNWRDAASAVSSDSELGNRLGSVRGVLSKSGEGHDDLNFAVAPAADESGIQQLAASIYCFPSVCYDSYPSDRESTALIIKARYGDDSESSYYRVNVGSSGNKSEVKANTKYLVTIKSVKGRGAATPEETYAADESQIVLSVVEDWDLDGNFAMDDNGNFIVLSTGHLDFEGDVIGSREVRVLTSKGLSWDVDFKADNDASSSAFTATRLSGTAVAIGTNGKNTGETPLSGTFTVFARTQDGASLSVDVVVVQNPSTESEEPSIPDDMPFALVPVSSERVKIDHTKRTIEIDGFDPTCFNSFIDIPFTVYVKDDVSKSEEIVVRNTLEWPLEGRISTEHSKQYNYCKESFSSHDVTDGSGKLVFYSTLGGNSVTLKNDEVIFVSVGAMGPDDPPIIREIALSDNNSNLISYTLTIKPRPIIIDDVVLIDDSGSYWLIQDRNIQNLDKDLFIGMDSEGRMYQAYNYSCFLDFKVKIPFKFLPSKELFPEDQHECFRGKIWICSKNNQFTNEQKADRVSWLQKCSEEKTKTDNSPFYKDIEGDFHYEKWIYPPLSVLELCSKRLSVSKLRMFLCSDIPAVDGDIVVPICCYWPYYYYNINVTDGTSQGYFASVDGLIPNQIEIISFGNDYKLQVTKVPTNRSQQDASARLVRPISEDELKDYKTGYLGYGSDPCRLKPCHPDTYTSKDFGWLPY